MTLGKSLVKQERKPSQQFIYAPSLWRVLHRVTYQLDPETRQSIMIPAPGTPRGSEPTNLTSKNRVGLFSPMTREDEPSKTKMTHMTKLFARKIRIVEESKKLAVIQRQSTSQRRCFWSHG